MTSKLQLTVPKKIADQYGIRPGDEFGVDPCRERAFVSNWCGARQGADMN